MKKLETIKQKNRKAVYQIQYRLLQNKSYKHYAHCNTAMRELMQQ